MHRQAWKMGMGASWWWAQHGGCIGIQGGQVGQSHQLFSCGQEKAGWEANWWGTCGAQAVVLFHFVDLCQSVIRLL